jgi:hypothetical protein
MTLARWIMRLWKRCVNALCSCAGRRKPRSGSARTLDRAHGDLPVARRLPARRLGRAEGETVRVCAVDPRDVGQAHQGQVRRKIERQFGGASVGAIRHHLLESIAPCDRTRRSPGQLKSSHTNHIMQDGFRRRGTSNKADLFKRPQAKAWRNAGFNVGSVKCNYI